MVMGSVMGVVTTMVDAMMPVRSECRSSRRHENQSKNGDPLHTGYISCSAEDSQDHVLRMYLKPQRQLL
jgi:hypothetical protein